MKIETILKMCRRLHELQLEENIIFLSTAEYNSSINELNPNFDGIYQITEDYLGYVRHCDVTIHFLKLPE